MKATTDPFEMADLVWEDTHTENFGQMATQIMTEIARDNPADSQEFIARVMELAWKTGFACGLEFMALGAIKSFPMSVGKN